MKFTKGDVKKTFTKCNRTKDDSNRCLVRSLFGVVPEYEAMGKEKVSGVLSFGNEKFVREFLSSNYGPKVFPYVKALANAFETYFKEIRDKECEEHCLVLKLNVDQTVDRVVTNSPEETLQYINSHDSTMFVVVHFLPSVSRDMFYAVSKINYNIAFTNRFSFNGKNFLGNILLKGLDQDLFTRPSTTKSDDEKIGNIVDQLSRKFGRENIKVVSHTNSFGYTQFTGVDITFDKLSDINILKLINIGCHYEVGVKASLQSMGMTKEEVNE